CWRMPWANSFSPANFTGTVCLKVSPRSRSTNFSMSSMTWLSCSGVVVVVGAVVEGGVDEGGRTGDGDGATAGNPESSLWSRITSPRRTTAAVAIATTANSRRWPDHQPLPGGAVAGVGCGMTGGIVHWLGGAGGYVGRGGDPGVGAYGGPRG